MCLLLARFKSQSLGYAIPRMTPSAQQRGRTQGWLRDNCKSGLEWPRQSLHLNPIKHLSNVRDMAAHQKPLQRRTVKKNIKVCSMRQRLCKGCQWWAICFLSKIHTKNIKLGYWGRENETGHNDSESSVTCCSQFHTDIGLHLRFHERGFQFKGILLWL